jgi:hypothetical protein
MSDEIDIYLDEKGNFLSDRISHNKRSIIEALKENLCNISKATQIVGISRQTFYHWTNTDPEFKAKYKALKDGIVDMVEEELLNRIKGGSDTAIIFFLKTQAKDRGYIERQEFDINARVLDVKYDKEDEEDDELEELQNGND